MSTRGVRICWFWVSSAHFHSGNANRRKFLEDDFHNLYHIVKWNNLFLTFWCIRFTVKKPIKKFCNNQDFFQFRVLTEGAECKKMNFRQNFQDLNQIFVLEIVGALLERCCLSRRLDRRFHWKESEMSTQSVK